MDGETYLDALNPFGFTGLSKDQFILYQVMSAGVPWGLSLIELEMEIEGEVTQDYEYIQRKNLKPGDVHIYYEHGKPGTGTHYFLRVDTNEPYMYLMVSKEQYNDLLY